MALVNMKVKINIQNKNEYTKELYNAIQGETCIVERTSEGIIGILKYLIRFNKKATIKYNKTAEWRTEDENMVWWIPEKDFIKIK